MTLSDGFVQLGREKYHLLREGRLKVSQVWGRQDHKVSLGQAEPEVSLRKSKEGIKEGAGFVPQIKDQDHVTWLCPLYSQYLTTGKLPKSRVGQDPVLSTPHIRPLWSPSHNLHTTLIKGQAMFYARNKRMLSYLSHCEYFATCYLDYKLILSKKNSKWNRTKCQAEYAFRYFSNVSGILSVSYASSKYELFLSFWSFNILWKYYEIWKDLTSCT